MDGLKQLLYCLAALSIFVATPADAADSANGKRLAQARCGGCHIVGLHQRNEVADSPPFEAIGAKFGFNPELLVAAILDPHPRMNLSLSRNEAEDITAYIRSLAP